MCICSHGECLLDVCTPIRRFKFNLPQELLKQFYSAIIESVLFIYNGLVWFSYQNSLQQTVRPTERTISGPLRSLQECYTSRVRERAKKVTLDTSHPAHSLFELLPSCRRYRAPKQPDTRTAPPPPPGHISPEQHITHPSTVNNSSNLHPYIGHIHSSVYSHFYFLYIFILLLLLFIIIAYSLHY